MKRLIVLVIVLSGTFAARAADTPSEFFAPWSDGSKAIVIDPAKRHRLGQAGN